jgi:hypothetical protein
MTPIVTVTEEELEIARKAIEDKLIDFRDSRISMPMAANGLVVHERNGDPSDLIRLTIVDALNIGLSAIQAHRDHQATRCTVEDA